MKGNTPIKAAAIEYGKLKAESYREKASRKSVPQHVITRQSALIRKSRAKGFVAGALWAIRHHSELVDYDDNKSFGNANQTQSETVRY